jgi:hypothetical protein
LFCLAIKLQSCTTLEEFFPLDLTPQDKMNLNLVCLVIFILAIFGIPYLETFQDSNPNAASRPAFLPIQTTIIYSLGGLLFTQSACQLLSTTLPCTALGIGIGTLTAVGYVKTIWDDEAWRAVGRMKEGVGNIARTKLGLPGGEKKAV